MRKKTTQSLDVANVKDAWNKFFEENKIYTEEELHVDGWLDLYEIAERLQLSTSGAASKLRRMNVENRAFNIYRGGKSRLINFFRLK
jgi:hypothetical protein